MKINYIHMPNKLLTNPNIHIKSKYLYLVLKINSYNNKIKIYSNTLLEKLQWKDNRTFKKYYAQLYNNSWVKPQIIQIPQNKLLEIKLINSKENFTMIDKNTILNVINICKKINLHEEAIILLYLYEQYYNYEWGYCNLSYEQINKMLKIGNKKISTINEILRKENLLNYDNKGYYYNESINKKIKNNNKYIPLIIDYYKKEKRTK